MQEAVYNALCVFQLSFVVKPIFWIKNTSVFKNRKLAFGEVLSLRSLYVLFIRYAGHKFTTPQVNYVSVCDSHVFALCLFRRSRSNTRKQLCVCLRSVARLVLKKKKRNEDFAMGCRPGSFWNNIKYFVLSLWSIKMFESQTSTWIFCKCNKI